MKLIERLINSYSNDEISTPGLSIAVVKEGKCIYKESYGFSNLENEIEVYSSSNFYLASISKTFTGAAIILLLQEKKLKLEDNITLYLKGLPEFCNFITIQHLLNHTSGLKDYFGYFYEIGILNDKTNDDVFKLVRGFEELEFPIGSEFKYSNTGYALLSMIIEKVSGQSYSDFLRENIFQPADMQNTYVFTVDKPIIPHRVCGYKKLDDTYRCDDYSLLTYGDGGIYSNVNDLINWSNAIDKNIILSQEYKDMMFTKGKTNNGLEIEYGCGWFVEDYDNQKFVYHTGGAYGFRTLLSKNLHNDYAVILLTNCPQKPWRDIFECIPKFMIEMEELY